MRVLHILDHSLPAHSGYTFRTRAIMRAQRAAGLEVRGMTGQRQPGSPQETGHEDGLTFHRTPGTATGPSGWREWREIGALADAIGKLAQEWRPDVLHAHSPALCGLAAARAARRLDLPLVYEIRAFWEDAAVENAGQKQGGTRYALTRALENRAVAQADAVFTICYGLRYDLVQRGVASTKIGVMPNGVDLNLFGTPAARDTELAQQLGLGEGPVIAFIGSFYPYEGIDDLVLAMPILAARHRDARLLLVGGGQEEARLHALVEASPAAHAIRFTGRVPHGEVQRYYALADIMAYPRTSSRLTELVTPLKPLEALAQDKLVAASAVGGHRELLSDGETGALFPPGDPDALGRTLADLIDRRADWPDFRARGQAHVRANHDWSVNVQRYQPVYQTLITRRFDEATSAVA